MSATSRTDRGWWAPIVLFTAWILAIGVGADVAGTAGAIAAWIAVPVIVVGVVLWRMGGEDRARRRHPTGRPFDVSSDAQRQLSRLLDVGRIGTEVELQVLELTGTAVLEVRVNGTTRSRLRITGDGAELRDVEDLLHP